jgi:hypothetical protein
LYKEMDAAAITSSASTSSPATDSPGSSALVLTDAAAAMQSAERGARKALRWYKIDRADRWRLITAYLTEAGRAGDEELVSRLRALLTQNGLKGVVYDHLAGKITRLNVEDL